MLTNPAKVAPMPSFEGHTHDIAYDDFECTILPSQSGIGVCLHPFVHSSAPKGVVLNTPEADAYGTHPAGFFVAHQIRSDPTAPWCLAAVHWKCCEVEPGKGWQLVAGKEVDPTNGTISINIQHLTLTPSILCRKHPDGTPDAFHAYITDGRWTG